MRVKKTLEERKARKAETDVKWDAANKERKNLNGVKRHATNKDRINDNKGTEREGKWRREYGLTPDQVHAMFDEQGGCCAICTRELDFEIGARKDRGINIDHCHTTRRVRGILCAKCNTGLGRYEEQYREFAEYLEDDELTIRRALSLIFKEVYAHLCDPTSHGAHENSIPPTARLEFRGHFVIEVPCDGEPQTGWDTMCDPVWGGLDTDSPADPEQVHPRPAREPPAV